MSAGEDRDGDGAFLIVHPFMWRELGLKGVQLLVFARVYGFCKGGGSFYESRRNTAAYLGISERSVIRAIGELADDGLIAEDEFAWALDGCSTRTYRLGPAALPLSDDKLAPPDTGRVNAATSSDNPSSDGVKSWHLISKKENKGF